MVVPSTATKPGESPEAVASLLRTIRHKATLLRIESIRATTEAGSGHPTSCCSAADIVATLFFGVMRYDPQDPKCPGNDRFILSKGHAAPLLYAAWAEAGLFDKSELVKLRTLSSDLEGHPTPRLPFVDIATGSLGQGLSAGIGIALNAKFLDKADYRTYVLLGDGESVEGSIWGPADHTLSMVVQSTATKTGESPEAVASLLRTIRHKATLLRIESIRATTEAGSGHPTSCCSAADIVATLFFGVMRYDPQDPKCPGNDRFILSKGHAAPLLYAAWAEAGLFDKSELVKLRTLSSDLEGHPTPRLPFVDIATGSLGQGLSAGIGIALNAKFLDKADYRTYVLLGDGESVEGSIWEAAEFARHKHLDNLCAIVDINRLGQSDPTILEHDLQAYRSRWQGFGWHALTVDGHDPESLLRAFQGASHHRGEPTVILAKTFKGKGVPNIEDQPNWHGKPLPSQQAREAIEFLTHNLDGNPPVIDILKPNAPPIHPTDIRPLAPPTYQVTDSVATREAFGAALAALGEVNPLVVTLDADVKNSTFTEKFAGGFPCQLG